MKGLEVSLISVTPVLVAVFKIVELGVKVLGGVVTAVKEASEGFGFMVAVAGKWMGSTDKLSVSYRKLSLALGADTEAAKGHAAAQARIAAAKATELEEAAEAERLLEEKAEEDKKKRAAREAAREAARIAAVKAAAKEAEAIARASAAEMVKIAEQLEDRRLEAIRDGLKAQQKEFNEMATFLEDLQDEIVDSIETTLEKDLRAIDAAMDAKNEAARQHAANIAAGVGLMNQSFVLAAALIDAFGADSERVARAIFAVQQTAAAANIIVSTAQAVMAALATQNYPGAAVAIATGAVALATVVATTFGSTSPFRADVSSSGSASQGTTGGGAPPRKSTGSGTSADAEFNDTPGPVGVRPGFDTFKFGQGDMVIAAKTPGDLQRQAAAAGQSGLISELKRGNVGQGQMLSLLRRVLDGGGADRTPYPLSMTRY